MKVKSLTKSLLESDVHVLLARQFLLSRASCLARCANNHRFAGTNILLITQVSLVFYTGLLDKADLLEYSASESSSSHALE